METFQDPQCKPSGSAIGNDNHLVLEHLGEVSRLPSPAGDLQSAKVSSTTNGDRKQLPEQALSIRSFHCMNICLHEVYTNYMQVAFMHSIVTCESLWTVGSTSRTQTVMIMVASFSSSHEVTSRVEKICVY